jgi:protein-tyrosine phosphatase
MPFSIYDRSGKVWEAYQEHKVDLVVLLVEPQEYLVYAGKDLPEFYRSQGLEVIELPVPDFGIPADLESWEQALESTLLAVQENRKVVVHCLAGLGRTGTFIACLAKKGLNLDGKEALSWVRNSIPGAVESPSQEEFIHHYPEGDFQELDL